MQVFVSGPCRAYRHASEADFGVREFGEPGQRLSQSFEKRTNGNKNEGICAETACVTKENVYDKPGGPVLVRTEDVDVDVGGAWAGFRQSRACVSSL